MADGSSGDDISYNYLNGMLPKYIVARHFRHMNLSSTDAESQALMEGLGSIRFAYYKCTNLKVPSTFSEDDLALRKRNAYCFANDILYFDRRWLMRPGLTDRPETPAIKVFLRGLKSSVNLNVLDMGYHSEKLAFLQVADILRVFCANITLNAQQYNDNDLEKHGTDKEKVMIKHLGMGVAETWRGTPDARLRGTALDTDIPVLSGSGQSHDNGSNGTSTVCEAKLKISIKKNLSQLVKTCVVTSFIERNLHPSLNTMVPCILIDTKDAVVALYCARTDLLLVSDIFSWRDKDHFNMQGIFFLWTMINHR